MNKLADVSGNGFLALLSREALKTNSYETLDVAILQKVSPMLYNNGEGEELTLDKDARGAVGETLLHTCFLSGLPKHMKLLASRLLHHFPKIINDFYINDEYYGETVLHMGIVSEDPEIVRFLLKSGANVNARCSGNFFTCDDQKSSRQDSVSEEHALVQKKTNYTGHLYWGEYPLSFAACLSQVECFRMLIAQGADPNAQDSNGNTVLHICTIHDNWMMFKLALSLGANLHVLNKQHLTPLTLAATLAKKTVSYNFFVELMMMEKIVEEERVVDWMYGRVRQALYPLEHIDSIEPRSGNVNRNSALALVVYGNSDMHLSLLPNLLEKLVQQKWTTYGRKTLFKQLFYFTMYFLSVMICFMMRPTPFERAEISNDLICILELSQIDWASLSVKTYFYHLLNVIAVGGAVAYLHQMHSHINNVGINMYFLSLSGFPAKAIFLMSCVLMAFNFLLRLFCLDEVEDILWIIIVLLTAINFLFFCRFVFWLFFFENEKFRICELRGFKSVGPFVLMLYKIIRRDLIRFLLIYLVIIAGFSQAFYIIFLGYKRTRSAEVKANSIMSNIAESYIRMFIMSLTEFATFFEQLEDCELTVLGKIAFLIYMLLVTLLLINMLIAMMTNTYVNVSGNSLEWIRQWAAIVLMMEQSFDPQSRLRYQALYSTLMEDRKRIALLLKLRMEDDEYSEEKAGMHHKMKRLRDERRRRSVTVGVTSVTPSIQCNAFSYFTSPQDSSRKHANVISLN